MEEQEDDEKRPFWLYFNSGTEPIPALAKNRKEAMRIGRVHQGVEPNAAVDEAGGETFDDVDEDQFKEI
jgi:hypothetical protein